jgi:hypothetical protein
MNGFTNWQGQMYWILDTLPPFEAGSRYAACKPISCGSFGQGLALKIIPWWSQN